MAKIIGRRTNVRFRPQPKPTPWNQKAEQQTQPEPVPVKKEPRYLLRATSLSAFGLGWLCATIFYIAMETLRLAL